MRIGVRLALLIALGAPALGPVGGASAEMPGPPGARVAQSFCRTVTTADYHAYAIHATRIGCRSVRRRLARWLRDGLPRERFGWYCASTGSGTRICSAGNGNAPRFTFRRRCRNEIRLGGRDYVFYLQRVGCRTARRAVRRRYRSGGAEGRPPGFRCESGSGFRQGGGCFTRGRVRAFGWHPLD